MRLDILKTLNEERAARRAAIVVTNQDSGAQRLVPAKDVASDPLKSLLALDVYRDKDVRGMFDKADLGHWVSSRSQCILEPLQPDHSQAGSGTLPPSLLRADPYELLSEESWPQHQKPRKKPFALPPA